ncbi:52 kda repressor of the inhibitor of the protein kinase [Plakobranchus ocellatus]|uniref:52 kDa repressor of the inhibitor of the protein kinase n=1 Tax=Plakobranchus ocellatus TaxID=259542 RepID=A0AAV3ZE62_9GAST|nr:52 kda repressor of the inhibitor of the protein kinase [Plakobranchus ocellatus]
MDSDIHSCTCVTVIENEIDLRRVRKQDVFMDDDMIVNHNDAPELDVDLGANETTCTKTVKKRETGQWCSAINCSNNRVSRPDLSFFRFPKDEERCRKWVINCRRADLLNKSVQALFNGNVLCALHFEDSQFANSKKTQLKRLKAVPTIFDVPNTPQTLAAKRPSLKPRKIPETVSLQLQVDNVLQTQRSSSLECSSHFAGDTFPFSPPVAKDIICMSRATTRQFLSLLAKANAVASLVRAFQPLVCRPKGWLALWCMWFNHGLLNKRPSQRDRK